MCETQLQCPVYLSLGNLVCCVHYRQFTTAVGFFNRKTNCSRYHTISKYPSLASVLPFLFFKNSRRLEFTTSCQADYELIIPVVFDSLQYRNDYGYPTCVIHLSSLRLAARDAPLLVKRKKTEYPRSIPGSEIEGYHHAVPPLSNAACSRANMAGTRSGKSLTTRLVCGSRCVMCSSRMPRP